MTAATIKPPAGRTHYGPTSLAAVLAHVGRGPFDRPQLTARQLAAALAVIDARLSATRAAEAALRAGWDHPDTVPEQVGDAWNALSDAIRELEELRAEVEANPRPIPAAERGTWELARLNID